MKWNFVTIVILVISSPIFCNASCELFFNVNLYCEKTTYEEYKNFIINEVRQPLIQISFIDTTITSLNNTYFDFEQVKDVEYFSTNYCNLEKVDALTFSKLKKLQFVSFYYNNIPLEISPNAFKGLESLKLLVATSCKITHIETGTFEGLSKLRTLDLSKNNITNLKAGTFLGATNVTDLWLHESQISYIELNAFDDLDNLEILRLWDNKLETLPLGLFKNLKKLKFLEVDRNRLDSLNFEALEGLSSLGRINITDNNIKVLDVTDVHKYTPNLKEIQIQ